MGVSGLLPLLKSIHKHTSLKAYAGQTLGVDAFGWLHRGAVACAFQLAFDKPTTQYVSFVVNRVRMLLDFGITPYLVFDGDSVPSKSGTNAKRRKEREAAKELGISLYRSGKKEQGFQELQKCVSVTPQMTFTLIEELRRMNVQILVAPYEADAQLAYLEKEGIIDGILSEDSDLLVFGAKKLITKLDQHGSCIEINRADLILNKDISFAGFSDTMFRRMAILSGCDYLPSVNGVGLRKGHEFVKKHKEIARIVRMMALSGKHLVPQDYVTKFQDAERTFLYHRVFCPKLEKMVFLNTMPPDLKEQDMPYLGSYVEPDIALGVAYGDLNPKTKERFTSTSKRLNAMEKHLNNHENRRQTIGGLNDLKPKRSIDNFFQPRRQPLAELDPNSLTPSPSQQRVLERNRNASWEPRHINSAPQLRRTVTDLPRSSSMLEHPQSRKASFSSAAAAATSSAHIPAKRQRLCSELDDVSPSKEVKHSRFFSPSVVEQSPLRNKKQRERKLNKPGFDVFSDDSVEDFTLNFDNLKRDQAITYPELPEMPPVVKEGEDQDIVPSSSPIKVQSTTIDSQSSHGTAELQAVSLQSQSQNQVDSQITVSREEDPEAFVELLDYHVSKMNNVVEGRRLNRTFSHQSAEKQSAALAGLKSQVEKFEDTADVKDRDETLGPEGEDLTSPQPVGRIKFQSLARTFACQSPELQSHALQSLGKLPAISNIAHSTSLTELGGSEDAIPFSSSQDEISEVEEKPARIMNLKQFQYIAS